MVALQYDLEERQDNNNGLHQQKHTTLLMGMTRGPKPGSSP